MFAKRPLQPALSGEDKHALMGDSTEIRLPPTASLRRFHASFEGQPGSEGRTRRIAELADRSRGHRVIREAAPDPFKNVLLFMLFGLLADGHHPTSHRMGENFDGLKYVIVGGEWKALFPRKT